MGLKAVMIYGLTLASMSTVSHAGISEDVQQLKSEFFNCVIQATTRALDADRKLRDPNLATEIGFQACATEENALANYLYVSGAQYQEVLPAISAIKRTIKATVRDVFENPKKYSVTR